jgi:hypothetical protein
MTLMEDLYYITPEPIGLEDIAGCAEDAGYNVTIDFNDCDHYLLIHFDCVFAGEPCHQAWRINQIPARANSVIQKECKRRRGSKPASEFHIAYPFFTIPDMLPFVRLLLERHHGWIETNYDYDMVTINNLDDLLTIDSDSISTR